jgi:hypothetical protein
MIVSRRRARPPAKRGSSGRLSTGSSVGGCIALLFLYLKQLQEKRAKRALIIAFDSSFPFSVGGRRLGLRSLPFSLLTFDFSRVPCIMEERVTTHRSIRSCAVPLQGFRPRMLMFRLSVPNSLTQAKLRSHCRSRTHVGKRICDRRKDTWCASSPPRGTIPGAPATTSRGGRL